MMGMAEMQGLVERLERAVGRLELLSAGSRRPPGDCGEVNGVNGGVAPSVEAFDKLMNSMVAEFLKKSRILAGDVETHRVEFQIHLLVDFLAMRGSRQNHFQYRFTENLILE
ncbi:adenylyl cyclase-associated protein 2 isoform 2-like protein [Camelus ferus]|nr:adenylyl cyclase-associated protein 2 isoform 2-like protein [Camelus ferus]